MILPTKEITSDGAEQARRQTIKQAMAKRKSVSIKDVARASGASLTTVSLVLNKRDRRISEETRTRILDAVERLGYRPSRLAQGLQSQRAGFLAILVPQLRHAFADAYFGELISAIQETARQFDFKVLLEVADEDYIKSREYLELFKRHFIDGLLCLGITSRDTYLRDFSETGFPVILVNNYLPDLKLNHVTCDYVAAGRLAGEHLAELGHRNVGLIHGASEVQTTSDLRRGFESALAKHEIRLIDKRVEDGLFTEEGGAAAAVRLLKRDPSITALLAGNDKMAIGALSGLKSIGLGVPNDVSVIGCDDIHQAEFCDPPLTTVHTPLFELGHQACNRLVELIEGRIDSICETCDVRLTRRKSAAPPRSDR